MCAMRRERLYMINVLKKDGKMRMQKRIDKGIPIPKYRVKNQFLDSMQVNDSIHVLTARELNSVRAGMRYRKMKSTCRKDEYGWRIWRTA